MPAHPADAKALFLEAVAIEDPTSRAALVGRRCGDDAELLARVNALLAANDRALAGAGTASFDWADVGDAPAPTADYHGKGEQAGAVIAGRYTLVEKIGEGGMGAVWRAQQTEPVKRFVAVKLIKAGMDSKQVLARFDAERQALALMDHPNIAKVLDGGLTGGRDGGRGTRDEAIGPSSSVVRRPSSVESGRPFFVMELVKGTPITEYCDKCKLNPKERLGLFVQACQAIQHAHQKGVIHRDIKPNNVLVALYDDRPVVKVIDFGVAKATGGTLTERTIDTGFGGVVGTPEYMSPEQATLNNLDIDTRSDVYSLGVLLYELLTGSPPFSKKELEKRGLLEMLRVVREEEPPRPSTKLSTADALPTLSANRGTEPKLLTGLLRNELDWVVMKALEKDRTRRYETANGFAADVRRYLSGEAVHAHPPSSAYRLKKFVRRNKGQVVAAAAVVAALAAGVAGATWQAVVANRARADLAAKNVELEDATRAAVRSRGRAEQREDMALEAIESYRKMVESNPDLMTRPDLKPLRQRLLAAPHDFYRRFKEALDRDVNDPSPPQGLDRKLVLANFSLAALSAESGLAPDAVRSYLEAAAILEPVVARTNNRVRRTQLATLYNNLGNLYVELGRFDEARATHVKGLNLRLALVEESPGEAGALADLSFSYHNLGWLDGRDGRSESALAHYRRAVEIEEKMVALDPANVGLRRLLATWLNDLGWMEQNTGRIDAARKAIGRAIEVIERCVAEQPNDVGLRGELARILAQRGQLVAADDLDSRLREGSREARADFTRARAIGEAVVAEAPTVPRFRSELAQTLFLAGNFARRLKQFDEAVVLQEKSVALGETLARDFPDLVQYQSDLANGLNHLGLTLVDAKRPADALPLYERARGLLEAVVRKNPADVESASLLAGAVNNAGRALAQLGRHEDAVRSFREAVERELVCMARDPKKLQYRKWLGLHYQNLGRSLRALGRKDEAVAVVRARLELHKQPPPEHRDGTMDYDIACDWAQTVPVVGRGKKEAELTAAERAERKQYADRAVEALRRAIADGFRDLELFRADEDLDPVRGREDFKQLMAELEAKAPKVPERK